MLNRFKIQTKIGASFGLGILLFALLSTIAYRSIMRSTETNRWTTHTYEVIAQLQAILTETLNAETGQRGYIVSGDSTYLEPYNQATATIAQNLKNLRRLTQDNPDQERRLERLEPLVTQQLAQLQAVIDLRRERGLAAGQQSDLLKRGNQQMDEIRRLIVAMETAEQTLLTQREQAANQASQQALASIIYGVPLYLALLILIGFFLARNISRPLRQFARVAVRLGDGDLAIDLPETDRRDEIGVLSQAFNQMIAKLRESTARNDQQTWLKSHLAEITQMIQGQRNPSVVARLLLSKLAPLVNAQHGLFYLLDSDSNPPVLRLLGSYAHQERKHLGNQFRLGEGLVGQCALEKQRILLTDVPGDYIRISSGLGEIAPFNVVVLPALFEQQAIAVLELASLQRFTDTQLLLLEQVSDTLGLVFTTIASDQRTAQLLEESQALTEELQQQQDELQATNRQLEEQAEALHLSEGLLKEQHEEMQQTNEELQQLNEELEEKAELLATQNRQVEAQNQQIELARRELEEKANQLALSSKYKSEFLANMSHELRTPLNSLLILAHLLSSNSDGNLTSKQVEYSQTIYSAGNDLLTLINDILDLAKIESGTLAIDIQPMTFADLQLFLERTFRQVAQDRDLRFTIDLAPSLPTYLSTDAKRLQQILKNLLANAFKFTEQGGVTLSIARSQRSDGREEIAFAVVDTGMGIAPEKQAVIFEAFQQADGTISRKHGGTGLGLSISRELAQLLGGHIELQSQPGQGSTFTLYLPVLIAPTGPLPLNPARQLEKISDNHLPARSQLASEQSQPAIAAVPLPSQAPNEANDDRGSIQPGDRALLVIEDDLNFVRVLLDMARQQGFKVLAALRSSYGLALAQEFQPDAIMLDLRLPDMDGWTVLDRLKHDPRTRHIPVHILSVDEGQQRGLQQGAIAYLQKPVSAEALTQALINIKTFIEQSVRNLLVVEDDILQAQSIRELIGEGDVQTISVNTGKEALAALDTTRFDCVVMDLGLPDMSGFDLIEQIKQNSKLATLPIIIYTGKELTLAQETRLKRLAETIIVKGAQSPGRLLDETALFLHRVQANLPISKRQLLEQSHHNDPGLANRTVLIVDDDVRNIFALTSLLESYQMQVLYAENGRDGIAVLQNNRQVDVVLMDIMMPELDGYETMRRIRQQEGWRSLPIIALTAKAMQGDREACLEAGASDYISKPVDTEQLLSLLRVWLYQ